MSSYDGEISVGAWGGPSGKDWTFKAKRGIKQIIIRHKTHNYGAIVSMEFIDDSGEIASSADASLPGYYVKPITANVYIDWPSEYLTGISGTYSRRGGSVAVTSLKLYTNRAQHGPFGDESGVMFKFNAEGGVVTGLYGRAGPILNAVGVFVKPVSPLRVRGGAIPNNISVAYTGT